MHQLNGYCTSITQVDVLNRQMKMDHIQETEFMIDGDGTKLKCVLPCSGSSQCDCLSGWEVTQINDISEICMNA